MRIAKNEVDVRLEIPGAVLRQRKQFGDVSGFGAVSGEYFSLLRRSRHDAALRGAGGRSLPVPPLGLRARRELTTTDADGAQETAEAGDLFYWPPGHNVRVDADAEIVMFSPERDHSHVIDHMIEKVGR